MKTNVELLFELYQEICREAGIDWTLEGWKFFDQVMLKDYERYCKVSNMEYNLDKFKKRCIEIALEMKEQV